ncbi:MAG: hypothetical protein F4Y18_01600 [Cenarchaeum sp. SB0663_bin_5]|nr:hypothetical protein [Cenarchaeum sp. SB0663_bin_5]
MKSSIRFLLILNFALHVTVTMAAESFESNNWLVDISRRLNKAYSLGEIENVYTIRSELLASVENDRVEAVDTNLVRYYVAMTYYRQGLVLGQQGAEALRTCIDQTLQLTLQSPDFIEGYILQAACAGALIPMRPEQVLALSKVSNDALVKSARLTSNNPRLLLINAISLLFAPPQFGGGKKPALEKLDISIKLFEASRQDNDSLPIWGLDEAYTWQGIIYSLDNRHDEAKASLQFAVSVNPDNLWVREILMPKVVKQESLAPMLGI